MQGFPLHPCLKLSAAKVCSFQELQQEARHPRRVGEQAGNSMNLAVLQLTQLHGYMSLVPRRLPTLCTMWLHFKRQTEEERRHKRRRIVCKTPAKYALWATRSDGNQR